MLRISGRLCSDARGYTTGTTQIKEDMHGTDQRGCTRVCTKGAVWVREGGWGYVGG